jgi:hypothetical protein
MNLEPSGTYLDGSLNILEVKEQEATYFPAEFAAAFSRAFVLHSTS